MVIFRGTQWSYLLRHCDAVITVFQGLNPGIDSASNRKE